LESVGTSAAVISIAHVLRRVLSASESRDAPEWVTAINGTFHVIESALAMGALRWYRAELLRLAFLRVAGACP
jgi:hypothetical protein